MESEDVERQAKLVNALLQIEMFLGRMVRARDHHANYGSYPIDGPSADQSFDDWAVDLAEEILEELQDV